MPTVFINYRTGDEENSAAMIELDLSRRFGSENIFRASKSIPPGANFEREILWAVRHSDVLLAVIGPRWLESSDSHGHRKLDDKSDWTRREIREAFRCDVPVIPILVGTAERLSTGALPTDLARLAGCQYLRLSYRSIEIDLDRVAAAITHEVPALTDSTISAPAPSDTPTMTNVAQDNARVGMQGVVNGNLNFGNSEN